MRRTTSLVIALALASLCAHPGRAAQGGADFSRYVAVGDGFTAGYLDGALHEAGQRDAYPVLVADAMQTPMPLPLVAEPGVPTPNTVTGLGQLIQRPGTCDYGGFDLATGRSTGRVDPTTKAFDVAVPFQRMGDAVAATWQISPGNPNDPDSFEDFVLGYPYVTTGERGPSTQVETAVALQPTFATVWLGPMDALLAAVAGGVSSTTPTPADVFAARADDVFDAIGAVATKGAILNVPNVTSTPLLVSPAVLRKRTKWSAKAIKKRLGVAKTSYVTLTSLPTIDRIVDGTASGPLAESQIVTTQELARIQEAVDAYNKKLAMKARALGWALVDVNALFDKYERRGVEIPGIGTLTTEYLGGLYGLDGLHPSETGQALIATAVISAINQQYGTTLPLPNVNAVAARDPHLCGAR